MSDNIEDFIKSIPEFKASRLSSLYSNFQKLKTLNKEGYEANIQAWQSLLLKLISNHKIIDSNVSFTTYNPDILKFLGISNYGQPQNLGNEYLLNHRSFHEQGLSYILVSKESYISVINDTKSYLSPKVFSPFEQLLAKYRTLYFIKQAQEALEIIKEEINKQATYSSKLFNSDSLFTFLSTHIKISRQDLDLFLKYWNRDIQQCHVQKLDQITYIKFSPKEDLTPDDIHIIDLQSTIQNLHNRSTQLSNKLSNLKLEFKQVLTLPSKQQQRIKLRHLLTQRQTLMASLEKTSAIHNELCGIFEKINDSRMNMEVYIQYLASSAVLKNMNSRVSIEEIEEVKSEIEEEMAKADEISDALVGDGRNIVDEDEIEKELEELEREVVEDEDEDKVIERLKKLNLDEAAKPISEQDKQEEMQEAPKEKIPIPN
ncbi:uncharacterized protein J8A68_004784 [[Candida] subhashii]|uniref:Vacuolar-sorting protein SNF7 n=1 Tax=[Candida] subhashii TaxID=561895 RepID=A0A8J5UK72_9ASCO|nr:uncharacterized protein J8A68_004784 [[Candida] subhashii]KAG7661726.1 hypothetical protein J8A68_004784 [[Candida] subhashii]